MSDASLAHLYGAGVFTTIRIFDGEPLLWDKHWRRLVHDAERIGLDLLEITENIVRRELDYALEIDEIENGRARITFSDMRVSPLWPDSNGSETPTTVGIITGDLRPVVRPFRLPVSPHLINSTSPLAGFKTCNYLDNMLALDHAHASGASEAIRLNEHGKVTSACMANLFWLSREQMFTPSLSTGCLPGTTREFVIESLKVTEIEARLDEIRHADAIFLTSAGLGIVQVDEFDGHEMPRFDHKITELLSGERQPRKNTNVHE